MLKHLLMISAATVVSSVWAPAAFADDAAADQAQAPQTQEEMAREIQELRARLNRLEQAQAATPPPAPMPVAASAPREPGDHNLELYGFIQLDAIQDFDRVNPAWDATLRPSRIPTQEGQFGGDGQSIFSVRQSRLGAKATGIVAGKPYEAKFEFDLFGVGVDEGQTTMRVRHMYASWGPVLAGQTNSVFMDGDIFPNTVDYWGPAGMVFVRNPQLRFTFLKDDHWNVAVALEHPSDDIDTGNLRLIDEDIASNIQGDEELPDFTAAVRYGGDWGHVRLAGLLRKIGYETRGTVDNQPSGSETGWGLNATSSIKLSLATLRLGAVWGRGIASYMNDGGMDLAPAVSTIFVPGSVVLVPQAEAVELFGMSSYVDLNWSEQWTSSLGYSFDKVDNTNYQSAEAFHKGEYASANVLWHPAGNIFTGLELLWGKRTDNDGDTGKDFRMQYTVHWDFTSKNLWSLFN
jgi:hypothetical protein